MWVSQKEVAFALFGFLATRLNVAKKASRLWGETLQDTWNPAVGQGREGLQIPPPGKTNSVPADTHTPHLPRSFIPLEVLALAYLARLMPTTQPHRARLRTTFQTPVTSDEQFGPAIKQQLPLLHGREGFTLSSCNLASWTKDFTGQKAGAQTLQAKHWERRAHTSARIPEAWETSLLPCRYTLRQELPLWENINMHMKYIPLITQMAKGRLAHY